MIFNFTLMLSGVAYDTEGLEDALFTAGCDDGLVCAYGNSVYLVFDREAANLDAAISSAVEQIEGAGIGARVQSVDSDMVGLSDIAEICELSRQSIAMLKDGLRGEGHFPSPVQRITGKSPLWSWAEVAVWLVKNGRLDADSVLVENAKTLHRWNLALQMSGSPQAWEIEALAKSLNARRERQQKGLA
ncbi:DNA-binding protein [Salmonella enterica subsp. enterica serovar Choleraesuis]|nr:DNA-binding protein [Salmonella enterica subsp. enterica serovar Choleraesuis]